MNGDFTALVFLRALHGDPLNAPARCPGTAPRHSLDTVTVNDWLRLKPSWLTATDWETDESSPAPVPKVVLPLVHASPASGPTPPAPIGHAHVLPPNDTLVYRHSMARLGVTCRTSTTVLLDGLKQRDKTRQRLCNWCRDLPPARSANATRHVNDCATDGDTPCSPASPLRTLPSLSPSPRHSPSCRPDVFRASRAKTAPSRGPLPTAASKQQRPQAVNGWQLAANGLRVACASLERCNCGTRCVPSAKPEEG